MLLGCSAPSGRSECGHTGLKGHFWSCLETSGMSQTRKIWNNGKCLRRGKRKYKKKRGVNAYSCQKKEKGTGRPGDAWTEETQVYFCPRGFRAPFEYKQDISSRLHFLPAGEAAAICLCNMEGLKLLRKEPWRVVCCCVKSWRECKKVDFCE